MQRALTCQKPGNGSLQTAQIASVHYNEFILML